MSRFSTYNLSICCMGLSLLLSSCASPPPAVEVPPLQQEEAPAERVAVISFDEAPVVRVLVTEPESSIRVRIPSAFFVGTEPGGAPSEMLDSGGEFVVKRHASGLAMKASGKTVFEAPLIVIRKRGEGNIYINGKPYRGGFTFRLAQGSVIAINDIEIDDYLKGVLPAEIGYLSAAQHEAYLAQAIASRSYSLSKLEEKRMEIYDMKATIMDQVYRGVQGEHPEASRAVDETRGIVAFFDGIPARMYYSACCGGHTADIRVGWPWKDPFPYLYGRRDAAEGQRGASFCSRSPHFRWRIHWSGRTLEGILKKTIPAELGVQSSGVGTLRDIRAQGVGADGRVIAVEIVTDRGTYLVTGDRVRWVMRPESASGPILKSTMFKMDVKKAGGKVSAVNLVGGGNGHGIGLCQAGTIRMAEQGYGHEEILLHYYPGVRLVRAYP